MIQRMIRVKKFWRFVDLPMILVSEKGPMGCWPFALLRLDCFNGKCFTRFRAPSSLLGMPRVVLRLRRKFPVWYNPSMFISIAILFLPFKYSYVLWVRSKLLFMFISFYFHTLPPPFHSSLLRSFNFVFMLHFHVIKTGSSHARINQAT